MDNKPLTGEGISRIDGLLKVTGGATYSAEYPLERLAYGFPLQSTIAAGRIADIDTREAEAVAGVLAVITYKNAPKLATHPAPMADASALDWAMPLLQDTRINLFGQYIGVVVAETYEQARHAARLVQVRYDAEKPLADFDANAPNARKPPKINSGREPDFLKGNIDQGLKAADVTLAVTYETPMEHHHALEPHTTIAVWATDRLTLYDSSQMVDNSKTAIAALFGLPKENVRVIARYIGGGFGGKLKMGGQAILATMASRQLNRPVKIAITRQMAQTNAGFRQMNRQHLRLGATKDGALTALVHETVTHTAADQLFVEQAGVMSQMMYNVPNILTTHRVFPLHTQVPCPARAPGEAPGSFALESAMDELAHQLSMDPMAFRIHNEPATNPGTGKPWSSRSLVPAMRIGAEAFGWNQRRQQPRASRQGNWLVGYGMAAASRAALMRDTSARVTLTRENRTVSAVIEMGATDIGTGSYTIIAQTAADHLGLPISRIRVTIGDSDLPATPGSGGSWGAASYANAVVAVCTNALTELRQKVSRPAPASATVADLMTAARLTLYQTQVTDKPPAERENYASYSFGAHFCEAWVDEQLGIVQVKRVVTAAAAGRILNPKTASSQVIGAVVWGAGMALTEESLLDPRYGNFTTRTLTDYHVPVQLDIGTIDVIFVPDEDKVVNRLGIKGVGEMPITGLAAAIANAVFNATGKRIRRLPITPDKLL